MPNVEIDGTNSTVKTNVLTSQSGTTITVPTGKVLTVTDAAGLTVAGTAVTPASYLSAIPDNSVTGGKLNISLLAGDTMYASGTDTLAKLAKGTAAQVLTMNSGATAPEWSTPAAGGAWTKIGTVTGNYSTYTLTGLDTTYDKYFVSFSNLNSAATQGEKGYIRLGTSSGIISSSNSYMWSCVRSKGGWTSLYTGPSGSYGADDEVQAGEGSMEEDVRGGWDGYFYLDMPRGGQRVKFYGHSAWTWESDNSTIGWANFSAIMAANHDIDRVQLYYAHGNIASGRATLYGLGH